MRTIDAATWARAYSSQHGAGEIRFAWNGKHGDGFVDANGEWRRQVLAAVLAELDTVPIELLRDLFEAETLHAREAWCVHRDIHLVGQALLERGGVTHVADFLRGKHRSFDTYMSCARVKVSPALASALAEHCRDTLADSAADDAAKALAKHGLELFGAQAPDGGGPHAAAPPVPHRWPPAPVTKDRKAPMPTATFFLIVAVVMLLAVMAACALWVSHSV